VPLLFTRWAQQRTEAEEARARHWWNTG